jgi:hypothetical protein
MVFRRSTGFDGGFGVLWRGSRSVVFDCCFLYRSRMYSAIRA